MLESALEKWICKIVKQCGGRAYKWVSPGCSGVPDRICILPEAKIIFIEVKRPGLEDGQSPRQKKVGAFLQSLGFTVWRVSDKEDFKFRMRSLGYEV